MNTDNGTKTPFKLLDLKGEEVTVGDTIAIARTDYRTPILSLSLVLEIKECPKTVRVYYKSFRDQYDYKSYLSVPLSDNGIPSDQLIKVDNLEFSLNQKKFAKLFVAKSQLDTTIPSKTEVKDEE